MLLLIRQMTSLIIKRQTIANMESDMDRWIQDRDRLSKQLEKCQMKYDNATVLQKVRIVWTSHIRFILTTACQAQSFLWGFKKRDSKIRGRKWKYLFPTTVKNIFTTTATKIRALHLKFANVWLIPVSKWATYGNESWFKKPGVQKVNGKCLLHIC